MAGLPSPLLWTVKNDLDLGGGGGERSEAGRYETADHLEFASSANNCLSVCVNFGQSDALLSLEPASLY